MKGKNIYFMKFMAVAFIPFAQEKVHVPIKSKIINLKWLYLFWLLHCSKNIVPLQLFIYICSFGNLEEIIKKRFLALSGVAVRRGHGFHTGLLCPYEIIRKTFCMQGYRLETYSSCRR